MTPQEIDIAFKKAVDSVNNHQEPFPADTLLKLYAYYKRATNSPHNPNSSKEKLISAFKTNALFQAQHITEDEAKLEYIDTAKHYFLYRK
ncbi:MAG: acyl-CoA-binding protein [Patiriisocius sp.]|jgi:acyl-CoA-binding protein